MWATFCNFHLTAQSKQSPIGRKFSQSGHPGSCREWLPKKKKFQRIDLLFKPALKHLEKEAKKIEFKFSNYPVNVSIF
jgi:hypothetical protein